MSEPTPTYAHEKPANKSIALEQALRTIDRLKAAMGEEYEKKDYAPFQKFCPECHFADAVGHATACTRGRFFAALKELDDA